MHVPSVALPAARAPSLASAESESAARWNGRVFGDFQQGAVNKRGAHSSKSAVPGSGIAEVKLGTRAAGDTSEAA
jgi:hypothetical protein